MRLVVAQAAAACLLLALHHDGGVVGVMAFSATPATKTTPATPLPTSTTAATALDLDQVRRLQHQKEEELRARHNAVAWNRLFVDVPERPNPIDLPVVETSGQEATLPRDFPPGCLLRLGPMGAPANEGFFDGDGMIHCITFPPSKSSSSSSLPGTFSSTYVDTKGRQLERANPGKKFLGTLGSPPRGLPLLQNILQNSINFQTLQGQKDTCNTALAQQNGRVLALMEQCPPSEICVYQDGRVATLANNCRLDNAIAYEHITGGSLSAHGRTCRRTGERIHVSYTSQQKPYCRVDVYTDGFQLKKSMGVNVACPTMIHDCCITEQYVVIFDFPLTLRTTRFLKDQFPVEYEPEYGARIGLLRRDAVDDSNIAWFECQPGVILHAVNAFETTTTTSDEDGTGSNVVTVQVLRSEPSISRGFLEEYSSSFLYEYNLDMTTKSVTAEGCLNPNEIVEFPVIHEMHNGKASAEHVYCTQVKSIGGKISTHRLPEIGITLDGVVKMGLQHDNKGKVVGQFTLPDNWYGVSEPTVVPKTGGGSEGEYVLLLSTFVPDGFDSWRDIPDSALKSRVLLLDGDRLDSGPVWQCDLPYHVPVGLHSAFLPWDCIKE
jgi:carotenoid cleavage dioxygenase-like enzyme